MTEQTIKRNLYSGAALCVLCIVLSIVSLALGMKVIAHNARAPLAHLVETQKATPREKHHPVAF